MLSNILDLLGRIFISSIFLIFDLSMCFLGKNLSRSAIDERLLFFKLEYLFSPNPFNESSFILFK